MTEMRRERVLDSNKLIGSMTLKEEMAKEGRLNTDL